MAKDYFNRYTSTYLPTRYYGAAEVDDDEGYTEERGQDMATDTEAEADTDTETVTIGSLEGKVICLKVMNRNIAVTVFGVVRYINGSSTARAWVGEFHCPPTYIVDKYPKKESHYIMYLWEQEGESFSS